MYSQVVSEKAAAQQRMFEDALLGLLEEKLFENISISELCRKTGLSRKTFYRLYEAKADVVYAMIDHAILDTATFVPDESVGAGGIHKFLAFWQSRKKLLDVLQKNQISALLQQQMIIHILDEAPELVQMFVGENSRDGRDAVVFYVGGLINLVLDWHQRGFDQSIDELSHTIMQLMMSPPIKNPLTYNPYE